MLSTLFNHLTLGHVRICEKFSFGKLSEKPTDVYQRVLFNIQFALLVANLIKRSCTQVHNNYELWIRKHSYTVIDRRNEKWKNS